MKKLFLVALLLCLYTTARAQFQGPSVAVKTVTALPSGTNVCRSNNQFTNIIILKSGVAANDGLYQCKSDGSGYTGAAPSSTVGAAGSNTQLQYNNSGVLGGVSGATSNGTNVTFGSGNLIATAPQLNGATSASGNFDLSGSSGTFKTTTGAVTIGGGGGTTVTDVATFTPAARASGSAAYFTVNIPTDTGQTAATESIGLKTVTGTRTWATTGTVALQRENFFAGPTYASASASQTFTDAFTLYATPPVAGTNAIFTRDHTLGIVDSTSASSSITGGLVVATTLGTTATSVGIGGGNVNAGGNGTFGGTLSVTGHATLEGVTSTGATGTGKFVFDTTPTFTTSIKAPAMTATADGTSELQWFKADGSTRIMDLDSTNSRLRIGDATLPTATLDVVGKFTVNSSGLVTNSNGLATAGQGFPVILGLTSQKSETTTPDASVLSVTPAAAVGTYRVSVAVSVSAATSGVISWTLSYTDSNGNAQSNIAEQIFQAGTAAPNTTFTTSSAGNYYGSVVIDVNNAAAAIVVKWVGGGTTTAKMSAVVERLN